MKKLFFFVSLLLVFNFSNICIANSTYTMKDEIIDSISAEWQYVDNIVFKGGLNNIEIRVYNAIIRRTFGYGKVEARISIADLSYIAKNKAIIKALKSLQEQNLIERIKAQELGPKQAYTYRIVFREDLGMPFIKVKESNKDKEKRIRARAEELYASLSPMHYLKTEFELFEAYSEIEKMLKDNPDIQEIQDRD